jgi:hypothetical protein
MPVRYAIEISTAAFALPMIGAIAFYLSASTGQ